MKIKIGNKEVEAEIINGVPVIKAWAEEIKHADGRVDVKVHVPVLNLTTKGE